MFRAKDREEELHRLEQELLEQEKTQQLPQQEEYLDEDALEELSKDQRLGAAPRVYRNFSNHYGKDLRNFASGYRAYNTDRTDVDPEELSRLLQEQEPSPSRWPVVLAVVLTLLAVAALAVLLLRIGGIL